MKDGSHKEHINSNYLVTKMDRYNKYQTKQCTHAHTSTLHTQQLVASTWLGDHQGRPSAPTNSLQLHMARYQVLLTYLLTNLLTLIADQVSALF